MKTSEAFQIWTECVGIKWEGNRVPLGGRKLDTATKLYFTFYVIWVNHVQNSATQIL